MWSIKQFSEQRLQTGRPLTKSGLFPVCVPQGESLHGTYKERKALFTKFKKQEVPHKKPGSLALTLPPFFLNIRSSSLEIAQWAQAHSRCSLGASLCLYICRSQWSPQPAWIPQFLCLRQTLEFAKASQMLIIDITWSCLIDLRCLAVLMKKVFIKYPCYSKK